MKNLFLSLVAVAALSSVAFAHHPSPSDSAGGNMSSSSGHLTNSLPAAIY
jgi:hypothetical protein